MACDERVMTSLAVGGDAQDAIKLAVQTASALLSIKLELRISSSPWSGFLSMHGLLNPT
jgi:hypothetical protein